MITIPNHNQNSNNEISNDSLLCETEQHIYHSEDGDIIVSNILLSVNDDTDQSVNGEKRKRNVKLDKYKWKRETNKKQRMNGDAYIGFKRTGKNVEQNVSRCE